MKVKLTRENFQKGLSAVAATIPTRTTLPVLSNILVETAGDRLRVRGTDLDISVSIEGSMTCGSNRADTWLRVPASC